MRKTMSERPGPSASIAFATRTRASGEPSAEPLPGPCPRLDAGGQEPLPVLRDPRRHLRRARSPRAGARPPRSGAARGRRRRRWSRLRPSTESGLSARLKRRRRAPEPSSAITTRSAKKRCCSWKGDGASAKPSRRLAAEALLGQQALQRRAADGGDAVAGDLAGALAGDPFLEREGMGDVAVDDGDAVGLAWHHLAQHHRLSPSRGRPRGRRPSRTAVAGSAAPRARCADPSRDRGERSAWRPGSSSAASPWPRRWFRRGRRHGRWPMRSSASSTSGSSRQASTRRT